MEGYCFSEGTAYGVVFLVSGVFKDLRPSLHFLVADSIITSHISYVHFQGLKFLWRKRGTLQPCHRVT